MGNVTIVPGDRTNRGERMESIDRTVSIDRTGANDRVAPTVTIAFGGTSPPIGTKCVLGDRHHANQSEFRAIATISATHVRVNGC